MTTNLTYMATITDTNGETREVTVVLVVSNTERILGYGFIDEFLSIPSGHVHVVDNSAKEPVSMHFEADLLNPKEIEQLRDLFRPKPSAPDLAKLAADLTKMQLEVKAAERFGQTDRIPNPKKYQRNRHRR